MFSNNHPTKSLKKKINFSLLVTVLTLSACSGANKNATTNLNQASSKETSHINNALPILNVYKSPSCSCCKKWLDHVDEQGFQSVAHNNNTLSVFKQSLQIAPQYRSCHTAVSKEGYIFEGHVPAKFIHKFLAEQHDSSLDDNVLGLAVPAMPIGTPGMEVGNKFMPYQVLLLTSDGANTVYATVNDYQEQF